ncbi:MAG: disulfide isomerase DsbC N-terminal domain-containing protein, partial [Burkholderiales bacterium]
MSKKSILNVIFAFALLGAGGAGADEASIRAEMVKKFPGANVESVQKTPHLGLYEIVVDGQIVYADEKFQYLIDGNIIELGTKNNITGARQRELEEKKLKQMAFPFEQLPFDLAFKKVK